MFRPRSLARVSFCLLVLAISQPALAENEGLDDLDKATKLKVTAANLQDLNGVVDHLDTALEKGLDKENSEFAEQLLLSTLLQRGTMFAAAVFNVTQKDPQPGLRILQFRQLALSDLQRVVQSEPKQWDAQLVIGQLQSLYRGDAHAAKQALSVVADADDAPAEQRAEALALRSKLQRTTDQQLDDLTRAVELQPESPEYRRLRAQHQLEEKKYDDALADVDRSLELEPEHPATNELRGMILLALDRYDDALASFNKAGDLLPGAISPYQDRAQLYRQKGDLEKAVEQLNKALELSPDNITILLVRAGLHYELQQPERALDDVDHAIRANPNALEPYRMRAEIFAATKRIDKAIAELERLVAMLPENAQAPVLSRLGAFYMVANQPHKAISVLTKAINLDPADHDAIRLRADAYLSTGQHVEAVHDFEHVLPEVENDSNLLNNFAWVLATSPDDKVRDGARAVELATEASELTGYETAHVLSTLAAAYAESGDFDNAKKWSAKAVETSQQDLDEATTDEDRNRLKTDVEQLKKELSSYEEGKPVRERQSAEDAKLPSTDSDASAGASAPPAPARTADY